MTLVNNVSKFQTKGGTVPAKLIVIRGNSGSGKTSIAREVRRRHGRGCALVEQDYLRRIVLRERDVAGGVAPGLIAHTARYALDHGYHVILEGILHAERYRDVLLDLLDRHDGERYVFYLDVSFDETVRRHRTRPQVDSFTPEQMREWYVPGDLLGHPAEQVIPESSTFDTSVALITTLTGLRATDPETAEATEAVAAPAG
jgi:predicted kinase